MGLGASMLSLGTPPSKDHHELSYLKAVQTTEINVNTHKVAVRFFLISH